MALTRCPECRKKSANRLNFVLIVVFLLKKKILKFTNKNLNNNVNKMPKLIEKVSKFTLFGWLFLLLLFCSQVG